VIPLFKVAMSDSAPAAVSEVLTSGQIGQGAKVKEFEQKLAERIGSPRVATVNSATSGLHLAVHLACDITRGRARAAGVPDGPEEVLSTPFTMEATNWAILANNQNIRWVDVDPNTLNVNLDDLERKISRATRAIVVVHFAGYSVDLNRLSAILDRAESTFGFRPMVIEDCAHAWGATYGGAHLGTHGNIAVFSFQAIKHLTCSDGGMVVLPEDDLLRRAKLLRWFGIDREVPDRLRNPPDVAEFGFKFHMTDVNATIGLSNLDLTDKTVARHRENAAFFDAELADVPGLTLTERASDRQSSFWVYPIRVERQDAFAKRLTDAGIMVNQVHQRNDIHSCVRRFSALLPGLDQVSEQMICLPVGWWVSDEDRRHIVDSIRAGW
jgi:dTDP-4-amino-4,6-dideoxy-D-glucose/dTDP-4-amino-2,4-dideoxy-beta-L-xylose transaminase